MVTYANVETLRLHYANISMLAGCGMRKCIIVISNAVRHKQGLSLSGVLPSAPTIRISRLLCYMLAIKITVWKDDSVQKSNYSISWFIWICQCSDDLSQFYIVTRVLESTMESRLRLCLVTDDY